MTTTSYSLRYHFCTDQIATKLAATLEEAMVARPDVALLASTAVDLRLRQMGQRARLRERRVGLRCFPFGTRSLLAAPNPASPGSGHGGMVEVDCTSSAAARDAFQAVRRARVSLQATRLAVADSASHMFGIGESDNAYQLTKQHTEPYLAIRLPYPSGAIAPTDGGFQVKAPPPQAPRLRADRAGSGAFSAGGRCPTIRADFEPK